MMKMESVRRRSIMGEKKANHTMLNYLYADNSPYIDTGIKSQSGITVEAQLRTTYSSTSGWFGSRDSVNVNSFLMVRNVELYPRYGTLSPSGLTFISDYTVNHIYKMANNQVYIDNVLVQTNTAQTFTGNYNMLLFAYASGVSKTLGRQLYVSYFKVWNSSGTLIQHLIPVLKDGVYCMYDNVSGTYYYNQGAGSFTGG